MEKEEPDLENPGFLDLTGPEDYNQPLRKWKAHWWGSRTSNPVCRLRGRQVGSIPMHFRQFFAHRPFQGAINIVCLPSAQKKHSISFSSFFPLFILAPLVSTRQIILDPAESA
jgi:hypothetical protein